MAKGRIASWANRKGAMLKAEQPFNNLLTLAFREARLYRSLIYLNGWHELLTDATHPTTILQIEYKIEQFNGLIFAASQTSVHLVVVVADKMPALLQDSKSFKSSGSILLTNGSSGQDARTTPGFKAI